MSAVLAAADPPPLNRARSIFGGSAGNLVEWYDWWAYSAFTLYFAPSFFPKGDQTAQLLSAAAVFAVGFLARPVGAWLMGLYSDRRGRKAGLTLSVSLMCAGSLLIAVCPTYEVIGFAAPAVLLIARLIQGLSLGGEYGASATYLSEMAARKNRGFWSSFQYVTLIGGQLLALAVLLIMQGLRTDDTWIEEWGWRIPFVIGALLAVTVFWLRAKLQETPSYTALRKSDAPRSSTWLLVRQHPKEALIVMGLTAGGSLAFYAYTTYMQKFLVNSAGFSRETATQVMAAALFGYMILQPLMGAISDRVGRKPMMIAFGVLGMLATYPLMTAIGRTDSPFVAFALIMTALSISACYTSISGVLKAELFPAHVRTLGVALPYALANAVFGGTAEYVALRFKGAGLESGFYWYVTVVLAVYTVAALSVHDMGRRSAILED
jgi:MHS family alpha-ketoglutarate permease-like MFS transporter